MHTLSILVLKRPRQEDCQEFEASLSYIHSKTLSLKRRKNGEREKRGKRNITVQPKFCQSTGRLSFIFPFFLPSLSLHSVHLSSLARLTETGPALSQDSWHRVQALAFHPSCLGHVLIRYLCKPASRGPLGVLPIRGQPPILGQLLGLECHLRHGGSHLDFGDEPLPS